MNNLIESIGSDFPRLEGDDREFSFTMGELALLFVTLNLPLNLMVLDRENNIFGTFTDDMWKAFIGAYTTFQKWARP